MYLLLRVFSWFLSSIDERKAERFAHYVSFLSYDVLKIRRKILDKNLTIAFGQTKSAEEISHIAKKSVANFFLTIFEFLRSPAVDIAGQVEFVGLENIRSALNKEKGCFVLCGHLGNWEAFAAATSRIIAPAHVPVKKVGSDKVNQFVNEKRFKNGMLTICKKKGGDNLKMILQVLKKGEIIGFIIDQAKLGEPRVSFFGQPAKTNTGLAILAIRHNIPIVPGYIVRKEFGHHKVIFEKELVLKISGDLKDDILVNTEYFNEVIGNIIKRHPEQYFWMHNRWK